MDYFDDRYVLLQTMYEDAYFPQYLVDKIKWQLINFIEFLEAGEHSREAVQLRLDEFTLYINSLKQEFADNDSEIETVARDSIFEAVGYILHWFKIDIPVETALKEREW